MFAARDIEPGEELSFKYLGSDKVTKGSGLQCLCGAHKCEGVLPTFQT